MSDRHELLPRVKNQVFEMIQNADLDVREFEWSLVKGAWAHHQVSKLLHPRTGFFFVFDVGHSDDYHPKPWPGRDREHLDSHGLLSVVRGWVSTIAPEIKAPDLWRLANEQSRIDVDPNHANTPFTEEEQGQIAAGLKQLEDYVYQAEPALPAESRQAVAARFSYLKSAASRLGRIDWTGLVVGQLFSMASERIITVQTFTSLYSLAASLLGKALALGAAVASKLLGG